MRRWAIYVAALVCAGLGNVARAEDVGGRGAVVLGWQTPVISRVVALTPYGAPGEVVGIGSRRCLRGYQFFFDVLDHFAFDIDEPVELRIVFDTQRSAPRVRIEHDSHGAPEGTLLSMPESASQSSYEKTLSLPRARFAGRGEFGTDLRIAVDANASAAPVGQMPTVTICDVSLQRSHATDAPPAYGWLDLVVRDEGGQSTPARVSLMDDMGRVPIPDSAALEVKDFSHVSRTVLLPDGTVNWPWQNRHAFYIDGRYRSRLPVGKYRMMATKGIEYRYGARSFEVRENEESRLDVKLARWIDMPARGWKSGDVHVHMPRRDDIENRMLWLQARAEDVHITNTLQMGNIATTYFPQSFWGARGVYGQHGHFLVAGQEDPRTAVRGHTVQLNLSSAVRNADRYLRYDEAIEQVAAQRGVSGYAHLDRLGSRIGLALDVPFGKVRFLEVLQRGELSTRPWFDFLNLGYKLAPAAGSDAPYGARIGDVRTYAKSSTTQGAQGWFDALSQGATFVTNGPIVDFEVNGRTMGDSVAVRKQEQLRLRARVSINPDIDRLERIELIEQGQTIKVVTSERGADVLELKHEVSASHGTWFVVLAYGTKSGRVRGNVAAASAPIYVSVDGSSTKKADEVSTLVSKLQTELDEFAKSRLQDVGRLDEWFETEALWRQHWEPQQMQLRDRIAKAKQALQAVTETSEIGAESSR